MRQRPAVFSSSHPHSYFAQQGALPAQHRRPPARGRIVVTEEVERPVRGQEGDLAASRMPGGASLHPGAVHRDNDIPEGAPAGGKGQHIGGAVPA